MSIQGRILNGRYLLGSIVGTGGMASVYRATDRVLQRPVAVKVLHFPYDQDPAFVTRFEQEARTAAGLSHPNIVAVFDTGSDDDLYYIVMEYVDGENLTARIGREGPLAPATAARMAWSVCQALAAAHARGVIHRDIKPANVIVSQAGVVKVTDFGIAKAMANTTAGRTSSGAVLGTASYMSPEQAQGQRVDQRSDLYSLGCVLYELLAGVPPFVNDTAVGVIWQHVTEDPEPLVARRPDVGAGLSAVVSKALAKQPAGRYQTAQSMSEDLEGVVETLATGGGPSRPHPAGRTAEVPVPGPGSMVGPSVSAGAADAATTEQLRGRAGWPLLVGLALLLVVLLAVTLRGAGSPAGERRLGAGPTSSPAATLPPATTSPAPATTAPATTGVSTTSPTSTASPTSSRPLPPASPSLPAALANLTEVLTAGVMEGTVKPRAYDDLVGKAHDVVASVQTGHEDEARKKLSELEKRTDELIARGDIAPAAGDRVREAVAEFSGAVERAI